MSNYFEKLDKNFLRADPESGLNWVDVRAFQIEGRGWTDTARPFARFPAKAKGVVRDPVWELSQHSAGLCIRFKTDSASVSARWTLLNENLAMSHMPATGVSGLDLYIRDESRPFGRKYHWIGFGKPEAKNNQAELVGGLREGTHEFMLYFPLYNGIESLEIGLPQDASLEPITRSEKPIVMYGTSILHGGCASRPGMSYPAIMGRRLDYPVINLGFSGNGQAEPEVAELLAELAPEVYVLDYCPNVGAEGVRERTEPFVQIIRSARPETPIVMVENIVYQKHLYVPGVREGYQNKNIEFRAAYDRLRAAGVKHLLYVPAENLLGDDGEGTVDGVHPTDVGFMRMAETISPVVEALL